VTGRPRSPHRLATAAVAIGLLGACAVLVVLVEAPGGHGSPRRASPEPRPRRLAPAVLTPSASRGLRLLREAATACQKVPFRGIQLADWWGPAGGSASVIQVWHRPGGAVLARSSSTAADPPGERQSDPDALPDSDEVMTLTPALVTLMRANYVLSYDGRGAVDGRAAQLVEVRRPGGGLAARFWIDDATRLPLCRELFDSHSRIFSEDAFVGLSVGAGQLGSMPAARAQPWSGELTAARRAALRRAGWPVPATLAGGLTLFSSTEMSGRSGRVLELSYSDGLSVISVFLQRGQLPRELPGWRRIKASGSSVYSVDPDDRSLAWSARGYVYTVISDAPVGTVNQAVLGLPHGSPPGFWERMGRGFRRMASWANPFR
jgi:sigma-E factor negative regulatory protein RseB